MTVIFGASGSMQAMDMVETAAQAGTIMSTIYVAHHGYENRKERVRLHRRYQDRGYAQKASMFENYNNELWPCVIQASSVACLGLNLIMEEPAQRMIVLGCSLALASAAARMQYCNDQKLDHDINFAKIDYFDWA